MMILILRGPTHLFDRLIEGESTLKTPTEMPM